MSDVVLISIARLAIILGQLGYVKLYSNQLSNFELGTYFFLLTVSYSLNAFLLIPVDYYQQSKIQNLWKTQKTLRVFLLFNKKILSYVSLATVLVAIVASIFRPNDFFAIVTAGAMAMLIYANQALRNTLNNLEHKKLTAGSMVAEAALKMILFWAFLKFMPAKGMTLLFSGVVALLLVMIFLLWKAHKLNLFTASDTFQLEKIELSKIWHFCLPISMCAVFNWIQLQGYRLILVPLGYTEIVGIYSTVSNIGTAVMSASSAIFSQLFVPKIYQSEGSYTRTYIRNALLLIVAVMTGAFIFSDLMVVLLTKESFVKYSWLIFFGIIAEAGNFLIGAFSIHVTLTGVTKTMLKSSIFGVLVMGLAFFGIYHFSTIRVETVGLPIIVSQIAIVLYMYIIFRKSGRVKKC
jgi:O-antigen/teichoic acid export membrane protein